MPAPTGKSVAVVGSGPAGLAAAQQLARAGHAVIVYERDDAIGGLLRYGIPDFKLEKQHIDKRLAQLAAEGVQFRTGVNVGVDVTAEQLRAEHDAVLLACGALQGRDTPETPGRELRGVHQAMAHLVAANRVVAAAGEGRPALAVLPDGTPIDAAGKHVVIIGGGDTAADCLGVAHRQGAAGVTSSTCTRSRRPAGTPSATRGRPGRGCCATTRRTRRAAIGSSPSRCRSSSTTAPAR